MKIKDSWKMSNTQGNLLFFFRFALRVPCITHLNIQDIGSPIICCIVGTCKDDDVPAHGVCGSATSWRNVMSRLAGRERCPAVVCQVVDTGIHILPGVETWKTLSRVEI